MDNRKVRQTEKLQAVAFIVLLATSSVFIAAPAFLPKASAAITGTITLSHTKLYGNSTLRIIVSDSDINANNAPAPDVKLTITPDGGSPGVPSKLNVTQLSDGSWVAHLTDVNASKTVFACNGLGRYNYNCDGIITGVINGTVTSGSSVTRYIQNHGALMSRGYLSGVAQGVVQVADFTRLDTLTFTYNDASGAAGGSVQVITSIPFDYSTTTIGNDRDVVGAGASLFLTVTDQDKNRDPTKIDRFQVNATTDSTTLVPTSTQFEIQFTTTNASIPAQVTTSRNVTAGTNGKIRQDFIETGPSTNIFAVLNNIPFNLTQMNVTASTLAVRGLLHGDQIQIRIVDTEAREIVGASSARATKTLTVTRTLGSITLSSSTLTYANDVTLTLTDPDRNNSTKVKEKLQVRIQTGTTLQNITMYETATDSGIFQGTLRATIKGTSAPAIALASQNVNDTSHIGARVEARIKAGEVPTFQARYSDLIFSGASGVASLVINFAISPGTSTSLSLDKASYGPTETVAIATLVDPDLNDSSGTQTLTKAGNHTLKIGSSTETGDSIGTFHLVSLNTTTGTQHIVGGLYFRATALETSGTSATFTFTIPLSNFTVNSGDQIRVSYFRNFDNTRVNATASIGGAIATIGFDRSDFPIAPGRRVNTTVVIVDPDRNLNPNAQESFAARLYPRNATDGTLGNRNTTGPDPTLGTRKVNFYNITLTETGANTGNFTLKLLIEWGASNTAATTVSNYSNPTKHFYNLDRTQDLVGGRLQVCVTDGLGPTTLEDVLIAGEGGSVTSVKGVCRAILFAVHGATMVANLTTGTIGRPVSVTLTEPDMNRDPSEKDKVLVNVEIYRGTTQPPEGVGVVCGGPCNATYTLTETGTSTGVFTNSSTIGTGSGPFSIINASQFVRVRYMDDGSLGSQSVVGFTKSKPTANIVIGSITGQLAVIPSVETGPFSTIVMTMVDADHSFNKSRVTLDKVVSEVTSDEVNSIVANKANRTTGTFTFNVTVTHSTSPVTGDQLLQVNATDKIHVFYTDRLDSAGQVLIIEKVINVATRNGAIAADKANYIVGEFITVTVTDIDANRDSSLREFVRPVIVTDSWAVGTNITLQETSEASGVFVGQVQVIDGFPGAGQVLGRIGDAVTIRYIDLLGNSGGRTTLTISNVRIGTALPRTQQVPASAPAAVDAQGRPLTTIRVGDVTTIQATVRNNDTSSHTFTYLVQVKNAQGVVVNLAWLRDITLAAGASTSPGLAWIPSTAGTYTVEVFVWESLANPIALSPAQRITVTVG